MNSLRHLINFVKSKRYQLIGRQGQPSLVCVDVGASYFLHKPWEKLLATGVAKLVAVDPNVSNLDYLDAHRTISFTKIGSALASTVGEKDFYVTNVDSGSSFYRPNPLREDLIRDASMQDYLFPVHHRKINVTTLDTVVVDNGDLVALKIDTQGAELEVLRGGSHLFQNRRVLSVELEISLLSRPVMEGSALLHDVVSFLSSVGFELMWIRPNVQVRRSFKNQSRQTECDALFVLRKEFALEDPQKHKAYISILEAYGLNKEIEVFESLAEEISTQGS